MLYEIRRVYPHRSVALGYVGAVDPAAAVRKWGPDWGELIAEPVQGFAEGEDEVTETMR